MEPYMKLFLKQLEAYKSKCSGDIPIPLPELLWLCYTENDPVDDGRVKAVEQKLEPVFDALPFAVSNDVFMILYELVDTYRRAAFLDGIHMGLRLAKELPL